MDYSVDARSFPVEFAALGILAEGPMHGYELRRRLGEGLGALWRIASSQLYAVLHRLEKRGWIDPRVESEGGRPSRTVYAITAPGERALEGWLATPVEHLRDMRVEFFAKVYFLRRRSLAAVSELVEAQIRTLEELESKLSRRKALESDDAGFGEMSASFRKKRVRSMIEWLEENKDALRRTEESR
ncbi:PadR family transcriptional regulator [Candidatus Bipolaricaulota bacterium]